jgi:hypothetical protein
MILGDDPCLLDNVMKKALSSLYEELATCDWYVREHEVVNLFVSGHLLPISGLDPRQVGIEAPVLKVKTTRSEKIRARKDLVIWREPNTTLWKNCPADQRYDDEALLRYGSRPYAIIEWKNVSAISQQKWEVRRRREDDIEWLKINSKAGMMTVGYAIGIDQSVRLVFRSTKVVNGIATTFLGLPQARAAATGLSD